MSSCEWNTREHACCASWDFHATVAKGKEEALDPSQQTGFKQPGFWITMVGFRIPLAGIPDSKAVDSGFHRPKLHGFQIPDYLTWGETGEFQKNLISGWSRDSGHNPKSDNYEIHSLQGYNLPVSPNSRARSRSTLIAVIVSKVTPHKIALVGLMSNWR